MSRPLVAILVLAAGIAAAAGETPTQERRERPRSPAPTVAAVPNPPAIADWMGHAVEHILSGELPDTGPAPAGGK